MDSRVILDTLGAETLLGKGDMLYLSSEASAPVRVQGVFVSDKEVEALVSYWQRIYTDAEDEIEDEAPWEEILQKQSSIDASDEIIDRAINSFNRRALQVRPCSRETSYRLSTGSEADG